MPRQINALRYVHLGKTLRLELLKSPGMPGAEAVPLVAHDGDAVVVDGAVWVVYGRRFDYDDGYLDIYVRDAEEER
jgi:hypothetical protein